MNAIEITNLTKKYKGFTLDNLCLNLPKGCIMGLIGENGAGKSTTIKMLLDIVRPDGGDIKIFGEKPTAIQKNDIGVVLDEVGIPESFTIKDISAVMKHSFNNWNEQTFFQYMAKFRLPEKKNFKTFSKGMKMKMGIAIALSHDAKLLILDEPTSGLDPNQIEDVRSLIKEIGKTRTVIISTHILSEVETLCSRVIIISGGKLVADSPTEQLRTRYGNAATVRVSSNASEAELSSALNGIPGISSLSFEKSENGSTALISIDGNTEIRPAAAKAVISAGFELYELCLQKNSLEDVFHTLTTSDNGEEK